MKFKIYLITAFILSIATVTKAQFVNHHLISIEGGASSMATDIPNGEIIRGNVPIDEWESTTNVTSVLYKQFSGLKYEYITMHDKLGLSTGVRYSRQYGIIGRNDNWDNTDFFYLRYREEGQNTEYFKINSITQTTDYVGIPLEVRLFPYRASVMRLYFRAGVELNYKLKTNTKVEFSHLSMDQYQDEIKTLFNEPKSFNANGYFTAGVRVGRTHRPTVNVEAMLPTWAINSTSTGMLESYGGVGVMVNLQVPLNAKKIEEASIARQLAAEQERVARENARNLKREKANAEKEQKFKKALDEKEDIILELESKDQQPVVVPKGKEEEEKRKEELINEDNEE